MLIRNLLLSLCTLILSGCAYNYQVGLPEQVNDKDVAIMYFDNRVKVDEIDGVKFRRGASIWVPGSHTVKLPPGYHTFKFYYDAVGGYGGVYTDSYTTLGHYLEADHSYEIQTTFKDSMIYFEIVKTKGEEKPVIIEADPDVLALIDLLEIDKINYGVIVSGLEDMRKRSPGEANGYQCLVERISLKRVRKAVVPAVEKAFTSEQIQRVLAFGSSDEGKAMLKLVGKRHTMWQLLSIADVDKRTQMLEELESLQLKERIEAMQPELSTQGKSLMEYAMSRCGYVMKEGI